MIHLSYTPGNEITTNHYKLRLYDFLERPSPLADGTVMRPVRLDGTTLWAFENDLTLPESHLLDHFLRCISLRNGTLFGEKVYFKVMNLKIGEG